MTYFTQVVEEGKSSLIVAIQKNIWVDLLKEHLRPVTGEVFFSSRLPISIEKFDYCFFLDTPEAVEKIENKKNKKYIFIFSKKYSKIAGFIKKIKLLNNQNIKIIELSQESAPDGETIDKIIWFSFSQSKESYLFLVTRVRKSKPDENSSFIGQKIGNFFSKKRLFSIVITIIVIYQFLFITPLLVSTLMLYQGSKKLINENFQLGNSYQQNGELLLLLAQKIYLPVRPFYLFLSVAFPFDNLFEINNRTNTILKQSSLLNVDIKDFFALVMNKSKSIREKALLDLKQQKIRSELSILQDNITSLAQKIPEATSSIKKIKQEMIITLDVLNKTIKLFDHIDSILGKNSTKKYLLLFANNKELRPGGGFIGSFGTITFKDMTMTELQIYDVYDADGQLIAHVEPPEAIRKYLNQPHWFLRDSAFSPDFLENYAQAKYFLEKEMNFTDFNGALLVTTTAIENLLTSFGDIYLSDYKEKVNSKNFYIKAQIYAQNNFFPGSIQKKSFLASLTRELLVNLETASTKKLMLAVKKSYDEKQLVSYFDDPQVQQIFDSSYWSGRVIEPNCPRSYPNCATDYIYPIDANLGVNKANLFITRATNIRIMIDKLGMLHHTFTIKFQNDAPSEIFPGGLYHNYFQVRLPNNTTVKNVTKNGVTVDNIDEKNEQYKTIGFIVDTAPRKTSEIKIEYVTQQPIPPGRNSYQLIVQKQIGSSNNDFTLEIIYPSNMTLLPQNFSPLVKDNRILYNTNLSADKIFFIETTQ